MNRGRDSLMRNSSVVREEERLGGGVKEGGPPTRCPDSGKGCKQAPGKTKDHPSKGAA